MKSSIILASLAATAAVAGPVKRALVTDIVYEYVTVTVTGVPGATPTADSSAGAFFEASSAAPVETQAPKVEEAPASNAASSAADNSAGLSDYAAPILTQHNLHRANHSSPALAWDDNLASIASKIANTCIYDHSMGVGGVSYGQNIGAGAPPEDAPKMITNDMYNGEINFYPGYGGEPDMGNFETWGHFSQIVWADTTKVGCATAHCPGGLANTGGGVSPYFTVCNYSPPGNFAGRYGNNIKAPSGDATVTV